MGGLRRLSQGKGQFLSPPGIAAQIFRILGSRPERHRVAGDRSEWSVRTRLSGSPLCPGPTPSTHDRCLNVSPGIQQAAGPTRREET